MKNLTKKKIITTITLAVTVALGLIAILTALRLYQLRQQAVAPTAPESKPKAAASSVIIPLSFKIATGPVGTSTARPTPTPTVRPTPFPTAVPTIRSTTAPNPNRTEIPVSTGAGITTPTATPKPLAANLEELTPTSAQKSLFTDFRIFLPILVAIGSGIVLIFISSTL